MAPDASSRGWGKAVCSEAAQQRLFVHEGVEDHVVVLARVVMAARRSHGVLDDETSGVKQRSDERRKTA